jgi:hypothetical protein
MMESKVHTLTEDHIRERIPLAIMMIMSKVTGSDPASMERDEQDAFLTSLYELTYQILT